MAGIWGFTPSDEAAAGLSAWWNTPVKNRYNILPLAENANTGENVWAVPGMLAEPFESLKRVIASGGRTDTTYDDSGTAVSGRGLLHDLDGLNVAGIAPMGTAMATMGRQALPRVAGREAAAEPSMTMEQAIENLRKAVANDPQNAGMTYLPPAPQYPNFDLFRGQHGTDIYTAGPRITAAHNRGSMAHEGNATLHANRDTAAAAPLALNALDKPKGITAYHGSPHDFDKFSLEHIGKGEGAQAYGHGLY